MRATGRLELAGAELSGERATEAAEKARPDMVVMDVHMPRLGGMKAAELIKRADPTTLVVLISTTHPDDLTLGECEPFVGEVIWKSTLKPQLLDDLWRRYSGDLAEQL